MFTRTVHSWTAAPPPERYRCRSMRIVCGLNFSRQHFIKVYAFSAYLRGSKDSVFELSVADSGF